MEYLYFLVLIWKVQMRMCWKNLQKLYQTHQHLRVWGVLSFSLSFCPSKVELCTEKVVLTANIIMCNFHLSVYLPFPSHAFQHFPLPSVFQFVPVCFRWPWSCSTWESTSKCAKSKVDQVSVWFSSLFLSAAECNIADWPRSFCPVCTSALVGQQLEGVTWSEVWCSASCWQRYGNTCCSLSFSNTVLLNLRNVASL